MIGTLKGTGKPIKALLLLFVVCLETAMEAGATVTVTVENCAELVGSSVKVIKSAEVDAANKERKVEFTSLAKESNDKSDSEKGTLEESPSPKEPELKPINKEKRVIAEQGRLTKKDRGQRG